MSIEYRPACPKCARPLVYQPSAKSYRCNPCGTTWAAPDTLAFKPVQIEVYP